jgi:hypothetical protein
MSGGYLHETITLSALTQRLGGSPHQPGLRLSPQNLNRNSVEEDGSATIVFEDRTASNER